MKIKNALTFNGYFETIQDFNSSFMRVKMKVFAFGNNRNGSAFNAITNKAKNSLRLIPIVAKYNEDLDAYGNTGDLESHNVMLRKTNDGDYEVFHDTYPFGVVGSNTNISFEEVNEGTDENPNIKTYVVIDDVYLWKRYEATKKISEWIDQGIPPKISMEIDNIEGQFDDSGYFHIEDFEFQAITALGSEVEPCFPKAEISMYSKQSFKDEFKELVYELKKTLQFTQEGGTEMPEENLENVVEETANTDVQSEFDEVNTDVLPESHDEQKIEEVAEVEEKESEEFQENQIETSEEKSEATEQLVDYEAIYNELFAEFETLQTEANELRAYKRQREEMDIKAKFEDKLTEEEFSQVFESMKNADIQDVEDKLFALYGKKNFSFSDSKETVNKQILSLPKEEDAKPSPYGGLFEKFSKVNN